MAIRWVAGLILLMVLPAFAQCPTCGDDCEDVDPTEHLKQIRELMREAEDLLINGLEMDEIVETQKGIVDGLDDQTKVIDTLDHLIKQIEEKG